MSAPPFPILNDAAYIHHHVSELILASFGGSQNAVYVTFLSLVAKAWTANNCCLSSIA
jgi:hypothetical protein